MADWRAAAHTPGPWWIGFDPDDGKPLEILAINHDHRVAFLSSDGRLSDARLIAAAPDLRAALVNLFGIFHARPDILALCGFAEHAQLQAAADALNSTDGACVSPSSSV